LLGRALLRRLARRFRRGGADRAGGKRQRQNEGERQGAGGYGQGQKTAPGISRPLIPWGRRRGQANSGSPPQRTDCRGLDPPASTLPTRKNGPPVPVLCLFWPPVSASRSHLRGLARNAPSPI